jgi:hypothetical protein
MTETTPTGTIRHPESEKPKLARTETQNDLAGPSVPQIHHSQASGQRTAPGRRPLFRS